MDIGSVLLILALGLLTAVFVGRPLIENRSSGVSEREHTLSALMAERDRLLEALLELDFDYKLGKVPEEIYPGQRANLMERGAEILKQLDVLMPESEPSKEEDRLEAAIAARRGATEGDVVEEKIAARRKMKTAGPTAAKAKARTGSKFCAACGKPVQLGDRFCPSCGEAL
ncbi:MAG: zinc ribbon domain-containing protein [Anaerolineae bacterium]|nr:MAG: zinc ribbon domain-containing protein [Anaerolineae bacterium]